MNPDFFLLQTFFGGFWVFWLSISFVRKIKLICCYDPWKLKNVDLIIQNIKKNHSFPLYWVLMYDKLIILWSLDEVSITHFCYLINWNQTSGFLVASIKKVLNHFGELGLLFLSFSVHFWAPTFKWGISIANIADFAKPPEKISYPQQIGIIS